MSPPRDNPDALPVAQKDQGQDQPIASSRNEGRRYSCNWSARQIAITCAICALIAGVALVDGKFDVRRDVEFELHTPGHGLDRFEKLQTDEFGKMQRPSSNFDPRLPTRLYVHGFRSSRRAYLRYGQAFLKSGDCNFIAVNWLNGSKTFNYYRARGRVERVGISIAELIDFLVEHRGLRLADLIVVGHSLGAHILGVAGQKLRSGRLPIIVGLDPASPLFSRKSPEARLSKDDADIVQVIHTNGGRLSMPYPVGDADFYPNWGKDQPGCDGTKADFCSHARAHKLYIESLSPNSQFLGLPCLSFDELEKEQCTTSTATAVMGTADPDTLRLAKGIYFLRTNPSPPYAMNSTGVIDEVYHLL